MANKRVNLRSSDPLVELSKNYCDKVFSLAYHDERRRLEADGQEVWAYHLRNVARKAVWQAGYDWALLTLKTEEDGCPND